MKIYYLINESYEGFQNGYRHALDLLCKREDIKAYRTFSFISQEKKYGTWEKTLSVILDDIIEYQPDVILAAHLSKGRDISDNIIKKIKDNVKNRCLIFYDERDMYGRFIKPLPENVLKFSAKCDAVFVVGKGKYLKRYVKCGCRKVIYLPHVADTLNFGRPIEEINYDDREYDVIMIANRSKSRIPFRSLPGIKAREIIVKSLYKKFGNRFAVFGSGWDGYGGNKGPINFRDQELYLRRSWISIGQDHFPKCEGYFSDRLPIALISGIAHVTGRTPGLEDIFIDKEHLLYFDRPSEAVDVCDDLLKWPRHELINLGIRGRNLVINKFTEEKRFQYIIDVAKKMHNEKTH